MHQALPTDTPAYGVLGASGGCGVSTVATLLDPSRTGGHVLEMHAGDQLPAGFLPLLVTRSTAAGLRAAAEMVTQWHPAVARPWLVVVRDAPLPVPRAAKYRQRAVSSRVGRVLEVPYLPALRSADTPADALTHRAVQRAASHLRDRLGLPA